MRKYAGCTTLGIMTTQFKYRRHHYHKSPKAGVIYCNSSYELRAALLLDENTSVATYETQVAFIHEGRSRRIDFVVSYTNGDKRVVEIKPLSRIDHYKQQIDDNRHFAMQNGYGFAIWTEKDLGFADGREAVKWADDYLSKIYGVNYREYRMELNRKKAKKHYKRSIATDTVEVYCEYCKETHTALRLTHDKNIARNGRYICEKEGGFIAGSKPKKKKVNPYAAEGKKQCTRCGDVKLFEEFNKDKSRNDGYANICQACNKTACTLRYKAKVSTTKELQ